MAISLCLGLGFEFQGVAEQRGWQRCKSKGNMYVGV